jgi:ABC-type branched-subunit amino acid transport system ATPase component/branched-subunit amino acid ABC-type transport system permease component
VTLFFQFAVLGLGAGGAYAIAGVGLTQIYRGSGVLNLAHGAMAFFSAVLFVWAYQVWHLPFVVAALIAVVAAALIGALVEVLVMRKLRDAAPLVRIIATLGVMAVLQQAVPLIFGGNFQNQSVNSFYPSGAVKLGSSVGLTYDRIIVVGVTLVLGVILRVVMSGTKFGLATTAGAENPLVASTMGVNTKLVGLLNWVIGSALAGLAGVLLVPILASLAPNPLVLLIIPVLAAAMIGRFSSYALTIGGGLVIGIGQSLLVEYQTRIFGQKLSGGWPDALPFLIIIVILMAGGTTFPRRGELASRLPRVGRTTVSPLVGVVVSVAAAALVFVCSNQLATQFATMAAVGIVGLSLVVITGLAGQTALAQLSISGIAAMVAAALSHSFGWPFLAVLVVGVAAGAAAGIIFALPAFRTRGPTLAIATLGVGYALENVLYTNGNLTLSNIYGGTPVKSPSLFGLSIDGTAHPQRYAALVVLVLGLIAVGVSNLRASPTGRRLLAVRSSERAAASAGIGLARSKTAAFVVAAAIASVGGVLLAFQNDSVTYDAYDILNSLNLVIFTLIGGVGYILGPLFGAVISPSGIFTFIFFGHDSVQRWLITIGGVGLIMSLIYNPDGQMEQLGVLWHKVWPRIWHRGGTARERVGAPLPPRPKAALEVRGLTVGYGVVTAVQDLSLTIEPGHIVGLIGPNGAGKTTAIDAISGFAKPRAGRISLGGRDLSDASTNARARAGMGRTFQTVEPFDDLTVAENLAVTLEPVRWWHWATDLFHQRKVALPASVREQARVLGLQDLDVEPASLSQGQRRLLGVIRAISARPAVLLLDEPAAGLNRAETEHLGQVLRQLATESETGMLLVEHDLSMVTAICDQVVAINFGETIYDGSVTEAVNDDTIRSAYLGESETATT